jgi:hypothetical protein
MTCVKIALAAGIATTLATAAAQADDAGYVDVNARDGVRVSARARAGSAIQEMRAISDIDAPPERVLAVLDDIERYPQFMPPTSAAQLLRRDGNLAYYYMEISPPVIARRDYCIRVGMQRLDGGRLRSYWVTDNSGCPPEKHGIVRVTSNDGEWILEPIDGGHRTHVIYRCHIEVGGHVPAWMVNRVSATELPHVFAAVRHAVSQPRYAACTTGPCRL